MVVWPIGMPLLYLVLLLASRKAIMTRRPTALSNATRPNLPLISR